MNAALSLQRLAHLKADAAATATSLGIKRTHALARIAQREGFSSWESLIAAAGKHLGLSGERLRHAISAAGRSESSVTSRNERTQRAHHAKGKQP